MLPSEGGHDVQALRLDLPDQAADRFVHPLHEVRSEDQDPDPSCVGSELLLLPVPLEVLGVALEGGLRVRMVEADLRELLWLPVADGFIELPADDAEDKVPDVPGRRVVEVRLDLLIKEMAALLEARVVSGPSNRVDPLLPKNHVLIQVASQPRDHHIDDEDLGLRDEIASRPAVL